MLLDGPGKCPDAERRIAPDISAHGAAPVRAVFVGMIVFDVHESSVVKGPELLEKLKIVFRLCGGK